MPLLSLYFAAFFVFTMAVYYILPGTFQWVWLFAASLAFYCLNTTTKQIVSFFILLLCNYLASLFVDKNSKSGKTVFRLIITVDILVLALFKYSAFILGLLGIDKGLDTFQSIVGQYEPLHISFFLLVAIGYVTDVYWGKCNVQKNPGKMILFTSFFPQMVSGPIVRYKEMECQLWGKKHRFCYDTFVRAVERILYGVFKKLVVSARCAVIVDRIYGRYETYNGLYIVLATVLYAFQLYTDFSGLMDIVLGVAECLGISLPENFRNPFFSKSISEFWRRWHITLGAFLKDYVLFSLQRSNWYKKLRDICKKYLGKDYKKKYNIPAYITLLIAWFLIGLWHGGEWKYIFGVGIYMWAVIVASELLTPLFEKLISVLCINTDCFSYRLFQQIRTFFIYLFGLSFFRADNLEQGFAIWRSAFSEWNPWIFFDGALYSLGLDELEVRILVIGLVVVLVVSIISEREQADFRQWFGRQNYLFRLFAIVVMFVCVFAWGYYGPTYNPADFVYGSF